MLLVAVLIVVLFGLILTHFGKAATNPIPANAVNINTATAAQFAQALSISGRAGQEIVTDREHERGHRFPAVYSLRHLPTLRGVSTSPIGRRFIARNAHDVARGFWSGAMLFILAFFAAHALLRRTALNADPLILPLVALLSGFGLMMVYTVKDPYRETFVFTRQIWGVAIWGLIALAVPLLPAFGRLALRRYQYAYAVLSAALMLLLLGAGHGPGGIHISVLGFEPVEIIKVLLVFFVCSYLAERRGALNDPRAFLPRLRDFAPLTIIYAFTLLLFVLDKDLGPAVLLFGAFLTLLYLSTQKIIYPIVGAVLLILAAVVGYELHFGFFVTRVTMWLNPWANSDPRGAQLADGLWGMATGGLWGSGLGLGDPGIMPRAGSDLIFASLGEELGLVGALSVLIVYCLLIARGFHIAIRAVTDFDRLLAAGLTILLTLQTMIIVGGVTGLVPLTGITLPFVSFGASSLVADFFAIGVLLHLSNKTLPAGHADRATPEWTRAARVILVGCGAYLLLGIGVARLMYVQGVRSVFTATRPLLSPDADQVAHGRLIAGAVLRQHINPRLAEYADSIPRGEILDRNNIVLAHDATPNDGQSTGLLTPDGRRRVYSYSRACAHLLMAVESPKSGLNPIGANEALRGFATYADLLPFYRHRYLPFARSPRGSNITLTIDATQQQAAQNALFRYASRVRDRRTGRPKDKGAAVLMDVQSGEVLAAATIPTFDPMNMTASAWATLKSGRDGQSTLINRATNGLYPPGSSFKIVTAAAGLESGLGGMVFVCHHIDRNVVWKFDGHTYARKKITDEAGFPPHGVTDMAKALRVSCNIYFANLGIAIGPRALDATARQKFGLAHMPTLAKLAEDLPDCAYGQGAVLTSPLEMARVAQAVANNGAMLPAQFIKGQRAEIAPIHAMSAAQAGQLQTMLSAVTSPGGTAQGVFDSLTVHVAGKTGSAQNNQGDGLSHSWFVGFAPATNPAYSFACIVENGGAGRAAAAPVCRDILRKAL